jgi:hypothetical protein
LNGTAIPSALASTYSSSTLQNGDVVTCQLTANSVCASPSVISSNAITVNVMTNVAAAASIVGTNIVVCGHGTSLFTANVTNAGSAPTYQWYLNSSPVSGANTLSYSDTLNNGDLVSFVLNSNAACVTNSLATSNTISITVNPIDTASINITSNNNSVCAGMPVTFTAHPVNAGANPVFNWLVNGISTGVNAVNYVSSSLANNDVITCTMISSKACVVNANVNSNAITMSVVNGAAPSVNITSSNTTICTGTLVNFTSTITNAGANPNYQWNINGNAVLGDTLASFSSNALLNGDIITCTLNALGVCGATTVVNSNSITINVTSALTPNIAIAVANPTVCAGSNAVFTATGTNMGTSPLYQWFVNSVAINGANAYQWSSSSLANQDTITCLITASPSCATVNTALSSGIVINVNSLVTPAVSISANDTSICAGTAVVFTPNAVNGGTSPSYNWYVNGVASSSGSTFTSSSLQNNDVVTCALTSSLSCVSSNPVNSASIIMQVGTPINPVLAVNATNTTICAGTAVTFTATASNFGANPTYQWMLNNTPVLGATASTYTSSSLGNGDLIQVLVNSSAACTVPASITSSPVTMIVNSSLIPSVSVIANPSNIVCSNVPVSFNANSVNGGTTPQYAWYVNNVLVGTSTSASFSPIALQNNDTITVTMTSSLNCASSANVSATPVIMTINTAPIVTSMTSNGPVCEGTNLLLNATSNDPNANFNWSGPNGFTSNLASPIIPNVNSANAGIYTVVANANACNSAPYSSIMQVNANPAKPFISQNGNVLSSSAPSGNQWYYAAAPISGATNNTYTAMQTGYYQVLVTNAAGCSSISDSLHVTKIIGVGIHEISINAPRIYPNPFETMIMLEWPKEIKDRNAINWQLMSINGQVIQQGKAIYENDKIELFDLSQGSYILKVNYKELQWQYPLIKQ